MFFIFVIVVAVLLIGGWKLWDKLYKEVEPANLTHDQIKDYVITPREIPNRREALKAVIVHIQKCEECREKYDRYQRLEGTVLKNARIKWRHLSDEQLLLLRFGRYDPNAKIWKTIEERHLVVCTQCLERFEKL